MPLLSRVAATVKKWSALCAPLEIDVHSEGTRDPDTREWIPGTMRSHTIRAVCIPSLSVSSSMGVQFTPSGPHEADEVDIFVPTQDDGQIYDIFEQAVTMQVQGENRDGTWVWPAGRSGKPYEIIHEIADFARLGGYRWFRARKKADWGN